MSKLPIVLHPNTMNAVVVGAGNVGSRRIRHLLSSGISITVVSPSLPECFQGFVCWEPRYLTKQECLTANLIVLCTDNYELHDAISKNRAPGQLIYRADDVKKSDFHFPAVIQRGKLTVATSTDGASLIIHSSCANKLNSSFQIL
ncbi:bifunctional precorrin-2 dehydrogenase/sirohydrochlorin ferrochelatase [Geomicrobium sp. JCM 19039]|uniref:precorrin-2 dehydrogenase/sirohydrochlorin ferrochelatase family protein n=1 Tax=Geomicrobium sp. JCM 19039 TaxID=1460636 RepID=UPI0009DFBAEE|nr:NAD(P)-dependent oxidoreductase [Geomicrobium sp. JCM 19039]